MEGWDIPFRNTIDGASMADDDDDDSAILEEAEARDRDRRARVNPGKDKAAERRGVDVALAVTNNANRVSLIGRQKDNTHQQARDAV